MELGTFGAIMKFTLELENEVSRFYESASQNVEDQNLIDVFSELLRRGQKRITTLERVRRENITEMILEPIAGLDSEIYKPDTKIPEGGSEDTIRKMSVDIEKRLKEFYSQASIKIDFLSEVAYTFELLAEANEKAVQRLSS